MAIYDPPDGSVDPRPRCTGHCCRSFSLELPFSVVQEEFTAWKERRVASPRIPDIEIVGEMLVPLGVFRGQELFTCRHHGADGNCGIYERRPRMCRDFPGASPCPYRNCASHGPKSWWRRAWNWIRE